jgi:hypothetical protein
MASIDIDIDDIISSLASYEKQELVDDLYDIGYVPKQLENIVGESGDEWDESVKKLIGNSWRLSKEDEETILKITNKIVL